MIEKIAYNLGRKDEEPNIELANEIIETNGKGIDEIVHGLDSSNSNIANNCIKVLYEIGNRNPQLISDYVEKFITLLKSRNNRLVWGAMIALSQVVPIKADLIYKNIDTIKKAYENGSVITVDYSISLFAELANQNVKYENEILPLILNHLNTCRPKEVPQHSERAFVCINSNNSDLFIKILKNRYISLTKSQMKRVDRLLRQAEEGRFCT